MINDHWTTGISTEEINIKGIDRHRERKRKR